MLTNDTRMAERQIENKIFRWRASPGDNVLDNDRAELSHTFAKPSRYTASVEREIGGAGTLHASVLLSDDRWGKQNSKTD